MPLPWPVMPMWNPILRKDQSTQILMDIANQYNGMVIGTGDMSEMALGWATYNGDHMSMYAVNVSIPKTLVRYLVNWYADETDEKTSSVLRDILATPVSPDAVSPHLQWISPSALFQEILQGPMHSDKSCQWFQSPAS